LEDSVKNQKLRITVALVLMLVGGLFGRVSAYFEWRVWQMAATGRISDQQGNPLPFTMSSIMNVQSGTCVLVLRDNNTGQFAMVETKDDGNCSE
jgi:hypothetical protein